MKNYRVVTVTVRIPTHKAIAWIAGRGLRSGLGKPPTMSHLEKEWHVVKYEVDADTTYFFTLRRTEAIMLA